MPFEADSEIWPYPRAPLDDRPIGDDNDILELDFADTSALSDPEVFKSKMMEKGKGKGKGEEFVKTNSGEGASRNVVEEVNGEGTGKKKETKVSEGTAEILPAALSQAQTRGPTLPPLPGPEPHSNGIRKVRATAHDGVLDRDVASKSIVTAVLSSPSAQKLPATLERNEFVREVLTLIHVSLSRSFVRGVLMAWVLDGQTDRSFVDGLWRDYMAKFHTASSTDTHL
jgi:hypothetical protein